MKCKDKSKCWRQICWQLMFLSNLKQQPLQRHTVSHLGRYYCFTGSHDIVYPDLIISCFNSFTINTCSNFNCSSNWSIYRLMFCSCWKAELRKFVFSWSASSSQYPLEVRETHERHVPAIFILCMFYLPYKCYQRGGTSLLLQENISLSVYPCTKFHLGPLNYSGVVKNIDQVSLNHPFRWLLSTAPKGMLPDLSLCPVSTFHTQANSFKATSNRNRNVSTQKLFSVFEEQLRTGTTQIVLFIYNRSVEWEEATSGSVPHNHVLQCWSKYSTNAHLLIEAAQLKSLLESTCFFA